MTRIPIYTIIYTGYTYEAYTPTNIYSTAHFTQACKDITVFCFARYPPFPNENSVENSPIK